MVIPIPYQIIIKRFEEKSFEERIEIKLARSILTKLCRIPKNFVTPLLVEMEQLGFITFENRQKLIIEVNVDCELLPRHRGRYE